MFDSTKGQLPSLAPRIAVGAVIVVAVVSIIPNLFGNTSGSMCRRNRLDEARLLANKLDKACKSDTGRTKLVYDFTDCLDGVGFARLSADTVKETEEGRGPIGIIINYSGSFNPGRVPTVCDRFKIYDMEGIPQGPTLSLPGGNRYVIVTAAVDEKKDNRTANITLPNFKAASN